jgi:hypothetical protein
VATDAAAATEAKEAAEPEGLEGRGEARGAATEAEAAAAEAAAAVVVGWKEAVVEGWTEAVEVDVEEVLGTCR